VVDIAVAAIEIAAAGNLQQDRINVHGRRGVSLAIVAVERAVIATGDIDFLGSHLLDQAADRRAPDGDVERLNLVARLANGNWPGLGRRE